MKNNKATTTNKTNTKNAEKLASIERKKAQKNKQIANKLAEMQS